MTILTVALKNIAFCPYSFLCVELSSHSERMNRVTDLADPRRCQGSAPDGQCQNEAEYGSQYCRAHGGVNTEDSEQVRSYLLSQADVKRRLAQLDSQQDPVRDLQRAISLTHLLIEKWVDSCKNDAALMASCGPLEKLIQRMESLIKSAVTVQEKLDLLLPRSTVLSLGQSIVNIIIEELDGIQGSEVIIDRIMSRIYGSIKNPPKQLEAPSV